MENYEELENFIFDDNVQDILDKIKNSVMNFNILEITGMGSQEIKHSNILAWMFSNSEHNLEYKILEDFLKKIQTVDMNEIFFVNNMLIERKINMFLRLKRPTIKKNLNLADSDDKTVFFKLRELRNKW